MTAGLSAELLLVLHVDAHSRLPVSTLTSLLTILQKRVRQAASLRSCRVCQPSFSRRLETTPATVVSADEPGNTALDYFNIMDVIFEVRVPDCTGVFKLWTDQAIVCSFFDFQLTVPEIPSQQAQCSV